MNPSRHLRNKASRQDSFFALGGHSLLAVRLVGRIRQRLGVEVKLAQVFACPRLSEMAAAMAELVEGPSRLEAPAMRRVDRSGPLPLSFAQQRLWFLGQMEGVSASYHIPLALQLQGSLDRAALGRSLDALWARHEGLRSVFPAEGGAPQVRILAAETGFGLVLHDLCGEDQAADRLAALCRQAAEAAFDLAHGPLVRGCLIRLGEAEHVLVLTQHHIVSDGWSMEIFLRELGRLYQAFARGAPDPLPLLAIQYPDYAVWQREWLSGERLAAQAAYWRSALADAPGLLTLPLDRPRPTPQSFAGGQVDVRLDRGLTRDLKALSHQQGTTLYMTVLAAWAVVLARLSGQEDVVIGTPVANRGWAETEGLIGFFVNTLALRMDLSGSPDVTTLLSRVRGAVVAGQEHQDLPFEKVVEIVQPDRRLDHTPLFQVMFSWQNEDVLAGARLEGLSVTPLPTGYQAAKFDLDLALGEAEDEILGSLGYATALFDAATVERHVGYLEAVLRAFVADAAVVVGGIDLLAAPERHLLLEDWNDTAAAFSEGACIQDLFEAQVLRTPEAVALVFEGEEIRYGELNARANRLAHRLIGLGVGPDALVGICVERSPLMIVGLLAVLKAGGAYVPLDPSYPAERLAFMLSDSAPLAVLTDGVTGGLVAGMLAAGGLECPALDLTAGDWEGSELNPERAALGLTHRHLAYVIYTSGSTGKPKGVMVEHRGLSNLLNLLSTKYPLSARDVVPIKTPFGFDASVRELFWPLICGARLAIARPGGHQDPDYLMQFFQQTQVTALYAVPSTLRALLDQGELGRCRSLKLLLSGAEPLSAQLTRRLRTELPALRIVSQYGPTETTVFATHYAGAETASFDGNAPIGRAICNACTYVVDPFGNLCPIGVPGELWIGGVGVARGYLGRPDLTAERFRPDPFRPQPEARIYRTGDLVRWRPDGNLEFLGRNDDQVKIRGFRIELGEIEAQLTTHPTVREAVVIAGEDSHGDKRLIAYVVTKAETLGLPALLRAHLLSHLPDHMVPAAFVVLDRLPLTPNGKVDRRNLPAPAEAAYARSTFAAPEGETEELLAALWRELLGVERIGRHDSFFTLGGHSLLAVRLVSKIRQLGKAMTVQDFLSQPTVAGAAEVVQKDKNNGYLVPGVVELNSGGSGRPLFIVHPSTGEVSAYSTLALAIGKDTPVFGLQAKGLRGDLINGHTIEDIADEYISRIRKIQPTGPYRLAAWSLGGLIAYEMARQLRIAEQQIEFLGLIDSANYAHIGYKAPQYISEVDDLLLRLPELLPGFNIRRLPDWHRGPRTVDHLLRACHKAGYFEGGLTGREVQRRVKVWRALVTAADKYVPLPSELAIHIFPAKSKGRQKLVESWKSLVGERITVEPMGGDHMTMIELPFCNALGAAIARALAARSGSKNGIPPGTGHTIAFILFPETSAFNGSYGLARALKNRGHRIVYHGPTRYASHIADQGFEYRPLDMSLPQIEAAQGGRLGAIYHKWRRSRIAIQQRIEQVKASDIRCETALAADQTSIVVTDPSAKIGVIPALRLGIPLISLNSTLASCGATYRPPVFSALSPPAKQTIGWRFRNSIEWGRFMLAARWKQAVMSGKQRFLGLGKDPLWVTVRRLGGQKVWNEYGPHISAPELVTTPKVFDFPSAATDPSRTYLGNSVDLRRMDGEFDWAPLDPNKKLIYCSLGTYSHEYRHAKKLFTAVIDAVRENDDYQAILQIGQITSIPDFEGLPKRIRVVKFAPQLAILEKADLFITQAGHSSVMEASFFGVPILAFPCWLDQFGNAARLQYHGNGIVGDIASVDKNKISSMIEKVSRGDLDEAVARMQRAFHSEKGSTAGVEIIERMMKPMPS